MKLIAPVTALLVLLAPLPISARSLPFFASEQSPIKAVDKNFPVEGENPLTYCSDPSNNILEILSVDLSPNPPQPGQTLTIKAKGIFHEQVERGAKVLLQVKYGLIRLINQEADLCEQLENNVDLQCPLEKGEMTFTKQVDLPKEIPPGKYSVLADVYTEDKRKITCLEANDIIFH
ncbi:hypothetical protein VTN77DRAFT_7406 [Rasamsonia byssochlamydoides]|uniref:uncharacterized protein n=1 Tax=Rasamsonia byssochlamydoides TaxID=89139 RepID=UPI003743E6DF